MGTNADTVRDLYGAFMRGDVAAVLGAMDDKIDWREPAGIPFDDQIGPQAVAEHVFGPLGAQVEGFAIRSDEIVEAGDTVFSLGGYEGKGTSTGIELDGCAFAHVWRFGDDGKIVAFRTYTDTHIWRQVLGAD